MAETAYSPTTETARWDRSDTRLRRRLDMRLIPLLAFCCLSLIAATGTACITSREGEPPPPTPDLPATIQAAIARAVAATAVPTFVPDAKPMPTPSPPPLPTFTPRPSATSPSSSQPPSPHTFGPRGTPAARSPLLDFHNGDWLEQEDPKLATAIKTLPWVADGIEQPETESLQELLYLATTYPAVFRTLMRFTWIKDGINQSEKVVVNSIHSAAYYDAELAIQISNLRWVANGVEQPEPDAVDSLWMVVSADVELAERIIALAWIEDGVTELENAAIENLFFVADADVALAGRIVDLPWVQDGVTELENAAMENLFFVADADVGLGYQVAGMTWLSDDVTAAESSVVEELWYIAYEDAAAAARLVSMPFLKSLEPPDVVATESLASLAALNPPAFREVMSHPTFSNGITDEWAPIVATLYNVSEEAPAYIAILLDPSRVTQEWRTVTLPHSGAVDLVIIRTGPGARRSMDLLENAVRSAEGFMSEPLPTNYVGLLFGNTVSGYSDGTNYATHIAVLPEYDVDDGDKNAEFAGHLIAHEAAHYYWARGRDWVDEGVSDLMASIAEHARAGKTLAVSNYPCEYTDNIAELERLTALGNDDVFECNYSLGEGFFLDLYHTLGDQAFREGLLRLYRIALIEDDADGYDGTRVGIHHVADAFPSDAAKTVINHWYYGATP